MMNNPVTVTIACSDSPFGFRIINQVDFDAETMELYVAAPGEPQPGPVSASPEPDRAQEVEVPVDIDALDTMSDDELNALCPKFGVPAALEREAKVVALADAITSPR